ANYIFYLIIWLVIQREVRDYQKSDLIAVDYYLTANRSKKDLLLGYVESFSLSQTTLNENRINAIKQCLQPNSTYKIWG
ncbi:MAG: hypothetical protein AABY22_36720, partial [Nanoarchaeota archaeon]